MTNFESVVLNVHKEAGKTRIENMLKKDLAYVGLVLGLIFSSSNETNAKTNYEALHSHHDIIAKYESGDKGYEAIVKDCYSGYSYGKWQISTYRKNGKSSTFDFFLKFIQENNNALYNRLVKAGGYNSAFKGDKRFIETWLELASNKEFQNVYDNFLLTTQIIPVYKRLDKTNNERLDLVTTWGSSDNVIQAAIKSIIIQHGSGGAFGMIRNVMEIYNPKTKEEFLNKLYVYRTNRFPKYKSRYDKEYNELKRYLLSSKNTNKTV